MTKTRAKFKVDSRTETEGGRYDENNKYVACPEYSITMSPVYSDDPESENAKFFNATPSGQITMGVVNEAAAEIFQVGKEVYVDFFPVE